jgi:uncharacterized protein
MLNRKQKEQLKRDLVSCLKSDEEIKKIVVFGSFLSNPEPHDMDVAVFQESDQPYLPLALKYRKQTRSVSSRLPLDIIPLKSDAPSDTFLREIEQGETVYER